MINLAELQKYAGSELDEIVANFEWRPAAPDGQSYGVTIKIKVYKDANNRFMALPSRRVKTPGQADSYMPLTLEDSIEDALKSCFRGFKMFMRTVAETTWPEVEEF